MTAVTLASPPLDRLAFAKRILHTEADALHTVAERLGDGFLQAVQVLADASGRVAVSGVGKSADVGQKLVGTLNSTGTRAYTLDATKALHGDLGMVAPDDVALLFSHSGQSEELLRLLVPLRQLAAGVVAVTGNPDGALARHADAAIVYGQVTEACPNSLAPSTSTTVMIAVGDALAFTLSELKNFRAADFARFHPAGSLGRKFLAVQAVMRQGTDLRTAATTDTVRSVFTARSPGRRTGAVMLLADDGTLAGIFTDSDLARLFESRNDAAFDGPIAAVMTRTPITIPPTAKVADAIDLMRSRKVSELPVVGVDGKPVGMIDITDLIGLEPPAVGGLGRPNLRLFDRPAG